MLDASLSSHLVHREPADAHLRVDQWDFGPMSLLSIRTSPMCMARTSKQTRADEPSVLSLTMHSGAGSLHVQDDNPLTAQPGSFFLVDLSRPYISDIRTDITGWSIKVALDQLGLPAELVPRARTGLHDSPLLDVFQRHFRGIITNPNGLNDDVAGRLLGTATVALIRALMASAAHDQAYAPGALADVLVLRIRDYVTRNLRDPGLGPASIAAAHHISLRHLYQVCAQANIRLEQLIIRERLEGARTELGQCDGHTRSVAATALRWGFTSASHFAHRFRAAYGLSPREWQHLAADGSDDR